MWPVLLLALLTGFQEERKTEQDEGKTEPRPRIQERFRVTCRDEVKGLTFDMFPDGRVELTVRGRDERTGKETERKYAAESMKEFRERHPEVVKEYALDQYVPLGADSFALDELNRLLRRWRDLGPDVTAWYAEVERYLDRLGRSLPETAQPIPPQPHLGVQVMRVAPTLAAQLKIPAGQGLVIMAVEPDSAALRAGLQIHDVILKLNGEVVAELGAFAQRVQELLKEGFTLEIIREGAPRTLQVPPLR